MSFETTERKFSLKYIIPPCSLLLMDVEALMGWIHGHYVMKPDFRCLFMYFEIMVYLVYLRTASTMCHAYSSMCFFFFIYTSPKGIPSHLMVCGEFKQMCEVAKPVSHPSTSTTIHMLSYKNHNSEETTLWLRSFLFGVPCA